MKSIRRSLAIPIAAVLLLFFSSAAGAKPPAHAPANGYRYQHPADRVVLVYNMGIAVYVVSGHPDTYFYTDSYYRVNGDRWYRATRIAGPWAVVSYASIPVGLHVKYKDPGRGH